MGLAGAAFALTGRSPVLIVAALTGTLSTDPNESGPITTVEQAMLPRRRRDERSRVYGRYNAVAYLAGAVGALAAGGPSALRDVIPALPPDQRWLLVMPIGAAVCALFAARLSPTVEIPGRDRPARARPSASREHVQRLAGLFALDAFAGGFIVGSFIVFWFGRQFGADAALMGLVFFGVGLLQAASSVLAGMARRAHRPAEHDGLQPPAVERAARAHPLAPTLGWAIALLLGRSVLSQMDVPARQAYVAALVDPPSGPRPRLPNAARHVVRPFGPALASASMGDGRRRPVPRRRRAEGHLRRGPVLHVPPSAPRRRLARRGFASYMRPRRGRRPRWWERSPSGAAAMDAAPRDRPGRGLSAGHITYWLTASAGGSASITCGTAP